MKALKRKLFLSVASLAVCAATLVSTTFAWYTSNTEVESAAVNGATSMDADTSSIYIAAAQTYDEGDKSVLTVGSYTSQATPVLVASSVTLEPVYYNTSDKTYKKINTVEGSEVTYGAETKSDILEYVLRFRTATPGEATPVYVSNFNISNTTAALPKSVALAYGGTTGIKAAGDYAIDLLKAIKMNVTVTDMTDANTLGSSSTTTVYDVASFSTKESTNVDTPNAVGYYNTVTGNSIALPEENYDAGTAITAKGSGGTAKALFTIPATGYIEVRFVFYLDGWDDACYDVCRAQTMSIGMSFTTSQEEGAITWGA